MPCLNTAQIAHVFRKVAVFAYDQSGLCRSQQYIESRKWGVKQAEIEFKDIDPYKVEAGEVPEAETAPKKRGRKPKKAA